QPNGGPLTGLSRHQCLDLVRGQPQVVACGCLAADRPARSAAKLALVVLAMVEDAGVDVDNQSTLGRWSVVRDIRLARVVDLHRPGLPLRLRQLGEFAEGPREQFAVGVGGLTVAEGEKLPTCGEEVDSLACRAVGALAGSLVGNAAEKATLVV